MSFEVFVIVMVINLITLIIASSIMYKVNGNLRLYYYHSLNWVFITLSVFNVIPLAFILNIAFIIVFGMVLIGFDSRWFCKIPGRRND